MPFSPTVRSQFSAVAEEADGFVYNRTTGEKNNGSKGYGLCGALRLLPSDKVTWDLAAYASRDNEVNLPTTLITGNPSAPGLRSGGGSAKARPRPGSVVLS